VTTTEHAAGAERLRSHFARRGCRARWVLVAWLGFACALSVLLGGIASPAFAVAAGAPSSRENQINAELAEFVGQFYDDPLGFVEHCYPWGVAGTPLEYETGPDAWQIEALEDIGRQVRARAFDGVNAVQPIRQAVSSGHGIGKSTYQAWLVDWIMSTRPGARGTVTANSAAQLDTKTWAAIQHWTKLCLTAHWFEVNTQRFYRKGERESWFCAPQSCKKENSEAFAGQHAKNSTSFYIFDEDSSIEDVIHEVAEGGLTDGEPMVFRFGNPTRSQGSFHRACFGSERDVWRPIIVDSRTSRFTNKQQIAEWEQAYGEDSDFFRVRVRGLPPSASDLQFIATGTVADAQRREAVSLPDDPLVCGLDVARGGVDDNVFRFRRGLDARSIPPMRIPGEQSRDSMRLVTVAAEVLDRKYDGRQVDMLFIDGTGIGGPIYDRLVQLGYGKRVMEVQFGAVAPEVTQNQKFANMRAYMWGKLRDWLPRGAIDADPQLEQDLTAPGYSHDRSDRIVLESKEHLKARGIDSPDDGDALALTFAAPVVSRVPAKPKTSLPRSSALGWMG
jgi:hypothetical protein